MSGNSPSGDTPSGNARSGDTASESGALRGRVVAIIGTGSELDRAIAVGCAEAGADIALGTESDAREQDYGMNSIANEIWAMGREHFVRVLASPGEVAQLVRDARARLGGCDVVVIRADSADTDGVPVVVTGQSAEATVAALLARMRTQGGVSHRG